MSLKNAIELIIDRGLRSDAVNEAAGLLFTFDQKPSQPNFENLRSVCEEDADYKSVALIMSAAGVFAPGSTRQLIEVFAAPFSDDFRLTPDYVVGTVIGIFNIGESLDDNLVIDSFEEAVSCVLVDILVSHRAANDVPAGFLTQNIEGLLSNAVKGFIGRHGSMSLRYGHFRNLLFRLEASGYGENAAMPPFPKMVIDQISYSQFGRFSTFERVRATNAALDYLYPRDPSTAPSN